MLIKKRDSKQADIDELTTLLSLPLSAEKKFLIERELRFIKSGDQGETDAAYFIDFHFGSGKNWAVIHDLRLEHQGRVAQIDHVLINRFLEVYLLESKNFSYGVKITDVGEFLVYYNKYFSIESPIEQNKRHLIVLEDIFKKYDIMPKRLGITMIPTFRSYILVSTKSRVMRPPKEHFDTSMVIKADTLRTQIDKEFDNMGALSVLATASKMVSRETIKEIAERLATVHKPITINYRKRFSLEDISTSSDSVAAPTATQPLKQFYCFQCKKKITEKVAKFCWDSKKRFHGKAYCFDCQKAFPGRH